MRRLTLLLILLLAAAARFHALGADLRFHGDEAWFATFARNAAVHGDWWLTGTLDKPPLPIYAMGLAMQGIGVTVNAKGVLDLDLRLGEWVARLPSVWAGMVTCAALMIFTRRVSRDFLTASLAGLIWALSPVAVGFDAMALTDPLMMAGLAVSLAAAVHKRVIWAGAAWVFAFASKQQAIFVLPLVMGLVVLSQISQPRAFWAIFRRDIFSRFSGRGGWGIKFTLSVVIGLCLLFLWDVVRPGESINSYAAVNNNPYRPLAAPSEWPERLHFWLESLSAVFGVFGWAVFGAGSIVFVVRDPSPPKSPSPSEGRGGLFYRVKALKAPRPVSSLHDTCHIGNRKGVDNVGQRRRCPYEPPDFRRDRACPVHFYNECRVVNPVSEGETIDLPHPVSEVKALKAPRPTCEGEGLGVRGVLLLFALSYILAHIILPFNLYERYILPVALLLTLPAAALIASLSRGRNRYVFPVLMGVMLLIPYYQPTTPRDPDSDIIELAAFVNEQGLGTIVYNRWLGWEMGYYLGAWSDKRVVYYPTSAEFAADAPTNPDPAPRLMIAPRWAEVAPWLSAAEDAGFEVKIAYENTRYVAWWLTPDTASTHDNSPRPMVNRQVEAARRAAGGRALRRFSNGASRQTDCPTTERTTLPSAVLGRDVTVSVYLPCNPSNQPLPYLIFLHGSNKDDRHLLELGLEALAPPFAVVMPFGGELANTNVFGEVSWGSALIDALPDMEARWPLDPTRRAIGGISRGGFWAYHVGLLHPELFRAIGGHSAFFDLNHAPDDANPLDLALTLSAQAAPALYLDRGADDYAAPGLDIMDARLRRADVPHTYLIHPTGEHDNQYWAAHLPEYVAFYAAALLTDPAPTATPAPESASGIAFYVPVAAFPSPLYDLDSATWSAVLAGEFNAKLTVSESTRETLAAFGVELSPDTRTLDTAEAVQNDLFRDRSRWTILPWDALNLRLRVLMVDGAHPVDLLAANYALAFESDSPNFDPEKLSRVMISGVTALARGTTVALESNGVAWAAEAIAPLTTRADLFHISSESSAIAGCPSVESPRLGGNTSFCTKPEHLELFTLLGADVIELSGNHNNDYGYEAYHQTLDTLRASGFGTVGGGETLAVARAPFLWEGAGGRVAWLACNAVGPYYALVDDGEPRPGATACDGGWLRRELARLKTDNDVVILTVQYLEFDQHNPTDNQRRDFATYAGWGADYVGGTQAHFPQSLNIINGYGGEDAFVHYGLGNFVFDQTFWAGVRFLLDELYIYDGRLHSVAVYPGIIEGQGRPRLMTPDERDNFWYVLFNQHGEF